MQLIEFPPDRVIEINQLILSGDNAGLRGTVNRGFLEGALSRIDNAIVYEELDDVFEIAAKFTASIAAAHAFSDANKRTGLAVALDYLAFNEYSISQDNELLADAVRDLVIGTISESEFADILYAQYESGVLALMDNLDDAPEQANE